jgi:GMP synthase (glutamine-hydrolysing)
MEKGFYTLDLTDEGKRDPLFDGFATGAAPIVCESHYCEIKTLPPGFALLASTPECRIQAMRHQDKERILYGFQFHPEDSTDRFPDGIELLERFFRIAE